MPPNKQFHSLLHLISFFWVSYALEAQPPGSKKWWKQTVFYQIYMPSYADSNGDGYGDFAGITAKLDYLSLLGVKGLWLTPFLESPKVDNGYDVSDYYKIDPTYGSRADFDRFLSETHKRHIKVIMDMVLNHTSTECAWFQQAKQSKDNPYRDYYIWKDRPNNWESFFGGTAWEKDETTNQYYYHKFDKRMPDLNWSNPKVVAEAQKILHFWLDAGVDGFRFDVINFLTTDGITDDNPMENGQQKHLNDIDQKSVKAAMKTIKATVNEYPEKFIVGEIGSDKIEVLKQYQAEELLDVVFNFNFGSIPYFSAERLFNELKSMEANMSSLPTLFFGSHDMPRMMDRLAEGNQQRATALAALILTAKGIPFVYYGEEIGMRNISAQSWSEMIDIQGKTHYNLAVAQGKTPDEALMEGNAHNRDKSRSPMQWNATDFAGFSSQKSWIKINPNYKTLNLEAAQKDPQSIWHIYQKLIALRKREKALQYGTYDRLNLQQELMWFSRILGREKITVVLNFGQEAQWLLPKRAQILMGTTRMTTNQYLIYKEILKN